MRICNRLRGVICGIAAAAALGALPVVSSAAVVVGVSVNIAPPAIPVYAQPPCPAVGYLWVPGYWAWGPAGYYWVPGTWVQPPSVGLLWTPGYWGWVSGAYLWHAGYWGPRVGFYGGINYGFGYTGVGFAGGYWRGGAFFYNRAVANVASIHVTNIYNRTVINNVSVTRVSFNGGPGGVVARPSRMELAAARDHHVAFAPMQRRQIQFAAHDHGLLASANGGRPAIAATMHPGQFSGRGVIAARSEVERGRYGAEHGGVEHGRVERGGVERGRNFAGPPQARFNGRPGEHWNPPQRQRYERAQPERYRQQPQRAERARPAERTERGEGRDRPR